MKMMKKYSTSFINTFLLVTILSIPFYQLRVPVFSTSLSVLTVFLCVLDLLIIFTAHDHVIVFLKKHLIFTVCILIFVFSFFTSLIIWPNVHSAGVFFEWLLLPAITCVFISTHLSKNASAKTIICIGLIFLFFLVSAVSLFYYFSKIMTYDHRLNSFFLSPNHLAMFLAPLLFILWGYLTKNCDFFMRLFLYLSLILGSITILLTQSFTTIFAICVTIVVSAMILYKKNLIFYLSVILIFLITGFSLYEKISNSNIALERSSLSSRVMIWQNAIFHIQKSPIFGYQIDDFQHIYLNTQSLFSTYLEWAVPTPHNLFLTLWISGGIFAVFSFITLLFYVIFCGFHFYHMQHKKHIILYCGALIVIFFSSFTDTPYWKNDLAIIFWIICGLILSSVPSPIPKKV